MRAFRSVVSIVLAALLILPAGQLPSQVATSVPIRARPVPIVPPDQQAILATWQEVYTTLFSSPYDASAVRFDLDSTVAGAGIYSGHNQNGEGFALEVLEAAAIDLAAVGLSPAAMQEALDQNITWVSVEATISSALGSYHLTGMSLSRQSATVPYESIFFPLLEAPTTLPMSGGGSEGGGGGEAGFLGFPILIPIFCIDPECSDACQDAYNDAVEDAQEEADLATDNENARHDGVMNQLANTHAGAITTATNNYNAAANAASTNLYDQTQLCYAAGLAGSAVCLLSAFFSFGVASIPCSIAVAAATATCVQLAYSDYYTQINTASGIYQAAVSQANTEYNTGVANENQQHSTNLQIIANNLQAAIDEAQEDLEDCLEDCPWVICGWIIIWIH